MFPLRYFLLLSAFQFFSFSAFLSANEIQNPGFESGLDHWNPFWAREPGSGTMTLDTAIVHSGTNSIHVEHHGAQDWAVEPAARVNVQPGDVLELSAWVKLDGKSRGGDVTLCVTTRESDDKVREWICAATAANDTPGWQRLVTKFMAPPGVTQVQPRIIGNGDTAFWADDVSLEKQKVDVGRSKDLPPTLNIANAALSLTVDTAIATFAVTDKRTGREYRQSAVAPEMIVTAATASAGEIKLSLLHAVSGLEMHATLRLDADLPEFTCNLSADEKPVPTLSWTESIASAELVRMVPPVHFPAPFLSQAGEYLVVPMNEGISYPVDDKSIDPIRLIAFGGHGICMAFWGVTDGDRGEMSIIETPDDAAIQIARGESRNEKADALLNIAPEWIAQRGQFGYTRRLRYIFFDKGGHVAIAKRYRAYAQKTGLFKTLAQKKKENPNVDLLVGAVNVWCWDKDSVPIAKEMQAAGIDRILWSNQQPPADLQAMNALGILTSRYDIYQDIMDPANYKLLRYIHPDWIAAAWPKDIIIDEHGNWQHGWAIEGKEGGWFPCGVLCDLRAPGYARKRIPAELETHPYRCRFIDTTTAAPWNECYAPSHPMTRTQSRKAKMDLLNYISGECKLVTGSETGHDAAVPFVDYFEGMLSLGPYRIPDAGRDMDRIWTEVPDRVAKFQLGQKYRLPLWELVYHDCVVAHWYWGDYNNKLPALWDKRDLFNALYGTAPMFMFSRNLWEQNKARFVQSYQATSPVARAAGYSEMIDHRFLTPDRNVQQTTFANGIAVTVNFGDTPWQAPDGTPLASAASRITGLQK